MATSGSVPLSTRFVLIFNKLLSKTFLYVCHFICNIIVYCMYIVCSELRYITIQ